MRNLEISALALMALTAVSGCATHAPYGNYAAASPDANKTMADSTAAQLVTLYPPAQTRFNLEQPATDPYGASLVADLRDKGYSLMEYSPRTPMSPGAPGAAPATDAAAVTRDGAPGLDLSYVVDAPESRTLYRVTVQVGKQSISRAFVVADNGSLYPAGSWVRKE
jgi:hypothetical protein